ncbi:MAG: multidrug efflux pump subunit AcrB [Halieaceae bacterium]|jgi:multidrug efflux pump subunit AcrB
MFERIIERGTLLSVAVLIFCILGIVAALRIPVQMIPDLDVRVISVRTAWPGATPQDVEKEILIEQEEYLRNLPGIVRIIATASTGSADIELEFPFGTDITEMLIRVNNALSQVPSYPEAVDEPRIYANSYSSNAFMYFGIWPLPGNPREVDMDLIRDFVEDNVKPRLSRISGISEALIRGGAERQVQILVDPVRLAQRRLSLQDVRAAIRSRNTDRSGGDIESGKRQYLLRTVGRFSSIEQLERLVLARRDDAVIRLSDVAEVRLDHFEKRDISSYNGVVGIAISLSRQSGSNVVDIKRDVLNEIPRINAEVLGPLGLHMGLFSDDVRYVEDSIDNVWRNLILGALLATAVMFLFLRSMRATFLGVLGIPICIIMAFLGLLLAGRTINVISLAGIAFAIGMTLDNSIVVLESIALERRRGADRLRAAADGVRSVWPAVFASTMTTILVFIPVVFVEQEAGQLYSDVAIAISFAILASMLVAITVLPTAAAHLGEDTPPRAIEGAGNDGLRGLTLRFVSGVLSSPARRFSCIGVTVLASLAAIVFLTPAAEYLPEGEEPKVFARMSAPPGYNLAAMEVIGKDVEAYFLPHVEADPTRFQRGETAVPALNYFSLNVSAGGLFGIVEPVDPGDIQALMEVLTTKYREYPGMRAFAARGSIISSNDGGTRSINLDVAGSSLNEIYRVARAVRLRAEEIFDNPRIQSQPSSLTLSQPLVELRPNWDRAAELGLTADSLGFTVAALTDGSYVDEFFQNDNKIDIYLYSNVGPDAALEDLGALPVYTPSGAVLPLQSLVSIEETVNTSTLRRVNGRRTVTVNVIPPANVPLEAGVERVRRELVPYLRDSGQVPMGVDIDISGAADQLDATREALFGNYAVAILIIYLLMVAIFTHWGYPLLIMTSIPLGIAGGIVGLALINVVGAVLPVFGLTGFVQPFDMISMLGFLILMGTVVNNPILVVHRAVENMKVAGTHAVAAVQEAVEARLRPIAMSTITTLCGLAPLVLIPGAGTELYRGVGAIVMFGILGAALVTLTMLPALLVTVLEWGERRSSGPSKV